MLVLDMVSYAPTPSMDRTVVAVLCCVAVLRAWMIAPVPARVDKANWCGLQAAWMLVANIWAKHRETTRRKTSPMTKPRTPPFGFCKATVRPIPIALAMVAGILAWAKRLQTVTNWVVTCY